VTRQGLTDFLVIATVIPAVLSVAFYARSPWWRSQVGQHLFAYMAIVALMLLLATVPLVLKPPPGWFGDVYLGCFALFMVVSWWRLELILSEQRETARRARRGRRRAEKTHAGPEDAEP
jgi:K+ transporter